MSVGTKLASFTATLIFAGSAFAQDVVCPDLSEIQKVGINKASRIDFQKNHYVGYSVHNYNTDSSWGFAIGPVKASSERETIEITNEILSTMSGSGRVDTRTGDVICVYQTHNPNILAIAIKDYFEVSPIRFKQFM
ncbi:hypothetical protein Lgra_2931 [Legionella gratiana]|uniref:Hemin binding protein (Hbp) homolog n=1 Tax=Legionella gratiana TaxID=45066 RepID=A0A378J5U4_9GAMM|nr:DUF4949 domain-containing protein [Legionella gratiana]KTD06154.1 hypothetical protein Lgra_2931 [Legionella gratiana]STX42975.1 hemin binding protein (Hbp) homolog [Legionella gratiana]